MVIKQAQIAAMNRDAEKKFLDRIAQFIADAYDADPHDPSVIKRCNALVRSARSYRFGTEFEIATFVSCGFVFGLSFDEDPGLPFAQILGDASLDAEFKAERMARVLDEEFDEAFNEEPNQDVVRKSMSRDAEMRDQG